MNNNWRRELTERLFSYFVQTAIIKIEKLEIRYEQKLNEGRPYLSQPLPSHVTFFPPIWSNLPFLSKKRVLFEWPPTLTKILFLKKI